jgi:hypothetical protein
MDYQVCFLRCAVQEELLLRRVHFGTLRLTVSVVNH